MSRILCIDEPSTGAGWIEDALARIGHRPVRAASLKEGIATLDREPFDLVVSRSRLPDGTGTDLKDVLRRGGRELPVILIDPDDGVGTDDAGVEALTGPSRFEALRTAVDQALDSCGLLRTPDAREPAAPHAIVGTSAALRSVLDTVRTVASTSATVLIEGESGTGKELLVRAIHDQSARSGGPLVAVNCAALPEGLIESTLFGHEKGSFTGASTRFNGAFERAHGGTLLLDEISELRLDLQAKLLRAIQEKQFERVGGSRPIRVDVRVVATTNRDLETEVRDGRFRADLFYRLRVVPVTIPPLRERREDIPVLIRHFVGRVAADLAIAPPELPETTLAALRRLDWPGNVRELEHAAERAVILNREGPLFPSDFGASETALPTPTAVRPAGEPEVYNLKELERRTITRALEATGGHRMRAAALLGISDRTLRNKLNVAA